MCGIAGFVITGNVPMVNREKLLDELLTGIDHRGGDATGFVAIGSDGTVEWEKAACATRPFLAERHALPRDAVACLAHTRFATQGDRGFARNNHPIKRGSFYLIHNGVVFNERTLYDIAQREPYGAVDSEALAALMAHADNWEATGPLMERVDGSAAIAALDERDGSVMLARISSSPLYVLRTRRMILWASTAYAVETAHKYAIGSLGKNKAVSMDEGEALIIRDGKVSSFSFAAPLPYYVPSPSTSFLGKRWQGNKGSTVKANPLAISETSGVAESEVVPSETSEWWTWCELCHAETKDMYDLLDEGDRYEVCGDCYRTFASDESYLGRTVGL